jgi:hypothetical protein
MVSFIVTPVACPKCSVIAHEAASGWRFEKIENHAHAMALHFLYYNFVRIH